MNENILKVIEELGGLLVQKDREITLQSYEIERLKKKIEELEQRYSEK